MGVYIGDSHNKPLFKAPILVLATRVTRVFFHHLVPIRPGTQLVQDLLCNFHGLNPVTGRGPTHEEDM